MHIKNIQRNIHICMSYGPVGSGTWLKGMHYVVIGDNQNGERERIREREVVSDRFLNKSGDQEEAPSLRS